MTGVPGQDAPEGDLSDNELKFVEQLYGDPTIPECPVCGSARVVVSCAPGRDTIWACSVASVAKRAAGEELPTEVLDHYDVSRFRQRRHADRDVMRLIAEVRRRRQVETGHAGAEPVVDDPRQASIFDLLHLGAS